MKSIKAMVVVEAASGPVIRQRDIDAPVRDIGQLLIEVRAASVNRADLAVLAGTHVSAGASTGPTVVGLDCAGVVLEADTDSGFAPGDRVMTMVGGGLAEQVVVDARMPIRLPDAWSFEMGAGAVLALMTGHNALHTAGRLAAGESVLVNAARSAVGQATIQIACELGAGRVLAAARSLRDETFLKGLGADAVVATGPGGFAEAVLAVTDGQGVDVIVDHVGGPYLGDHVAAAALKGRIVGVGRLGGAEGALDMETLAVKRLDIVGVTFRTRDAGEKAAIAAGVRADLAGALDEGRLTPRIDRVLPWTEVLDAQDIVAADAHLGKIVLTVSAGA
ncbi:zinc-binding dehydrogenase [Amycolatopsis sp. NBC_01480]|uniref:zinc-binding dehydrogenase n=1 Tax=Amycolatopsis sp. NBC_01480 TaxID=2903562 RepID=UPI002E2C9775|nr:zinc-binding dehydrogenase [Amycolatopsis sp. NBC_01480]